MVSTNIDTKFDDKNQEELLKETEEMYRAGVHFGYSRSSRHPKMEPFFYGLRNDNQIFNLEVVHLCLKKAVEFLKELGSQDSKFLFVATKPEIKDVVEKAARELGMSYVVERWLGGTLTNFNVIKKRIAYFEELSKKKASGEFSHLSKKEASRLDKQFLKLEKRFAGIQSLKEKPAALVVVDPKKEEAAVAEAKKRGVPMVAIMNSDCDPSAVDYPVPGNDASLSSVTYLLGKLVDAYKEGVKLQKTAKEV